MKKQLITFTIVLAAIITFLIVTIQKPGVFENLENLIHIPKSEAHKHVTPSGEIVEHTHFYDPPESASSTEKPMVENDIGIETDIKDYLKMNDIHRIWSNLDLKAIKSEFQPYTLEEIHEKWRNHLYVPRFTGRTSGTEDRPLNAVEILDNFRDRDEWIQRLYNLGFPFLRGGQYYLALDIRNGLKHYYDHADDIPPHERVALPPEATWEDIEETYLKRQVIAEIAFERAYQVDPDGFTGGVFTINNIGKSVLTPFKENTVYLHISEDSPFSQFTGVKLTNAEKKALTMFGIAPKGMKVVYTDKDGIPLPPDIKPRFYERAMAQLDGAEQQVVQQIADHDALFNQAETGQEKKPIVVEKQHEHPHPHENMPPTHKTERPGTQQKMPPQFGKNLLPPVPTEPHDPVQVQKWFEELVLLHGGDLPKDLKALQKAIIELGAIRTLGEKTIPKPPERRTPPNAPSDQ